MKILLVNDDGFHTEGIDELEKILTKFGEVYMVAPKFPQSGKGCSFTSHLRALPYREEDEHHIEVDGSPIDCVNFAVAYFPFSFSLVVSGCNDGWNIAYDILYSGTVGACIQAQILGLPSIAFSSHDSGFMTLKEHGFEILERIFAKKAYSPKYVINVNLPKKWESAKEMVATIPFPRQSKYDGLFIHQEAKLYRENNDECCKDERYDLCALHQGKVSISYLRPNWGDVDLYPLCKKDW